MSPGVFDLETEQDRQITGIWRRENEASGGFIDFDNALGPLGQRAKTVRSANK